MPLHQHKPKTKAAKYPRNNREAENSGLSKYIIRTRRQSKEELLKLQTNMAACKGETSEARQHIVSKHANDHALESIQENLAFKARDDSNNCNQQSGDASLNDFTPIDKENLHSQEDAMPSALNNYASDQASHSTESLNVHKGMVADMVNKINHTPTQSPSSSPVAKMQRSYSIMASNLQGKISDVVDDHLNSVIQQLSETSKTLNQSVAQLQHELSTLRTQKALQDAQVSDLINSQKADAIKLQNAMEKIDQQDRCIEAMVGILSRQNQELAGFKRILNNMAVRAARHNLILSGIVEERNENTKWKVLEFFKGSLKLQDNIVLNKAYRIGNGVDRPIIIELQNVEDKAKIYQKVGNLKGVKNSKNKSFFISDQLPEDYAEKR